MNFPRFIFWGSFSILAVLFLAACSQIPGDDTPPTEPAQLSEGNVDVIAGNLPADFEITIYQGAGLPFDQKILLSELLATGKPVVLNFWAGLCPPCRLEMPDLQAVHEANQDQIVLFGLDVGPFTALGTREDGQALLEELEITYPAGTTFDSEVVRAYGVLGMPTTYFITPDGNLHQTWTGILTREKLAELVEDLLSATQ